MTRAFLISVCPSRASPPHGAGREDQGRHRASRTPTFFVDKRWSDLDTPYVRYVIPGTRLKTRKRGSPRRTRGWPRRARERANMLVTFGHSRKRHREGSKHCRAAPVPHAVPAAAPALPVADASSRPGTRPTTRPSRPVTGPTARRSTTTRSGATARSARCRRPRCSTTGMLHSWIKRVRKKARYAIPIWSIHNHIDANRHRLDARPRSSSRRTQGQLWFTETGGIANRWVDGNGASARSTTQERRAGDPEHLQARAAEQARQARSTIYKWIRAEAERRRAGTPALIRPQGQGAPVVADLQERRCGSTFDDPQRDGQHARSSRSSRPPRPAAGRRAVTVSSQSRNAAASTSHAVGRRGAAAPRQRRLVERAGGQVEAHPEPDEHQPAAPVVVVAAEQHAHRPRADQPEAEHDRAREAGDRQHGDADRVAEVVAAAGRAPGPRGGGGATSGSPGRAAAARA